MTFKHILSINSTFYRLLTLRSTHGAISYASCPGEVPLLPYTAGQLLERAAEKHPDKDAFIFPTPGVRFTFQQLLQKVFILNDFQQFE